MKVAVIGATGQLGMDVAEEFVRNGDDVSRLAHADIEISSLDSVRGALAPLRPSFIVNTAAMHQVDSCEQEPSKAYLVNAIGARNLALVARELDAVLVHVSTDYVFDGLKGQPYLEDDSPRPLNVYGNTKFGGEVFVPAITDKYFILRTSALYGVNPCRAKGGRNFVELMLKLAGERDDIRVVNDEVVTPTSTAELARQIVVLSRTDNFGLFHATAEGSCTWYQFAKMIFQLTDTKTNLAIAAPNEFPMKVPRPKYSVLENHRLKTLGLNCFRSWEEGLRSYLAATRRSAPVRASSAIGSL
jgi:dTDP-4-dehydrorhamnose reductase